MAGVRLRLDQALEQLVRAAVERLEAARDGGLLDGIEAVVSGDRARGRPPTPYLWVAIAEWREETTHALHYDVTVTLMATAMVASDDPEHGWLDAMLWAARARSVLLAGRKLDLDWVQDTQPASGTPVGQIRDGRRFAAAARVDVEFQLREETST